MPPFNVGVRNADNTANISPLAEGTFTDRIGAVTASPASNTVLDRLKALLTGIVLAAGANIIGSVKYAGTHVEGTHTVFASGNASGAPAAIGPAPTTGEKSRLLQAIISVTDALVVTLEEETSADDQYVFSMAAGSTIIFAPRYTRKLPTVNKRWMVLTSGAGAIKIETTTVSEA